MHLAIVSAVLIFIAAGASSGGRVAVTLLALKLDASPLVVGTLLATYSAIPALLGVPLGRLVDRIGVAAPVISGLVAVCLALLLAAVSPTLPTLYVVALLIGAGIIAASIALGNAVGMASAPSERTRNFALYTVGISASNAVGPMIIGFAIDGFGFQGGFLLMALLSTIAMVVFWIYRRIFPPPRPKAEIPKQQNPLQMLMDRQLRPVFIASTTVAMIWDVYQFIAPVWGTQLGLSASSIGVLLGSFSAATFFVRAILPLLSARFSEWALISATIFTAGVGFAMIPLASTFGPLVMTSILLGAGFGFGFPMILSVSFAASPKGREAEVSGIRYALSAVVHFFVPLIIGALTTALGLAAVAWGASAVMFGGSWNARRQARLRAKPGVGQQVPRQAAGDSGPDEGK